MTDTGQTTPATTRTSLGGWTLLLALTLTVHAAAVSTAIPVHRPAMVEAVVRLLASAHTDLSTRDDRSIGESQTGGLVAVTAKVVCTSPTVDPTSALLLERLNLPPPAHASSHA